MNINRDTRRKRIQCYGYTPEEADNCPIGKPLWMYRIEQEEGRSLRSILEEAAATARDTGYTLRDLAREWNVNHATLLFWAHKWGIRFPCGVSSLQKEAASRTARRVNQRRSAA